MKTKFLQAAMVAAISISGAASAEPGVTANTIVIGQSAGLTGGQADYSKDVKQGMEAYFTALNKSGGVNGRKLKLVTMDDQGKKDKVVANTKTLVEVEKVFALIGYTSGAGVEAALSYIDSEKVPMLSPATGNMGIRTKFHHQLFHTRAGYNEEMNYVVKTMSLNGIKRFAIAYLDDVGPANPKAMIDALATRKLVPVAEVPLNRNSDDFTPQIDALMKAQPEAVLMISNAKPIAKVVQGMKKRDFAGQFIVSSFAGATLISELNNDATGLIMIQVLPPVGSDTLRVAKDFAGHLKQYAPEAKPNPTSFEGYIAARVMAEGIKRAGSSPTRVRLVDGLESINNLDLGGYKISFSNTNHDGATFVDAGIVRADGSLRF